MSFKRKMCHWEGKPVITITLLVFHTSHELYIIFKVELIFPSQQKTGKLYLWWSPFHSEFVEDFWSELPLRSQDRVRDRRRRGCWDRICGWLFGLLLCEGLPLIAVVHSHLSGGGERQEMKMQYYLSSFLKNQNEMAWCWS